MKIGKQEVYMSGTVILAENDPGFEVAENGKEFRFKLLDGEIGSAGGNDAATIIEIGYGRGLPSGHVSQGGVEDVHARVQVHHNGFYRTVHYTVYQIVS